jgi:peptidoglycan L-alanyl-D-glutamate endopeptidase CwlK
MNFSKHSIYNLSEVDFRLQELAYEIIKYTEIDFGVSDGLRTLQEQQMFFNKGLSRCDGIIKKSKHQEGKAIDIFAFVDGKLTYEKKYMLYLTGLFKNKSIEKGYVIRCGIDWVDFPDFPHIEIKN